MKLLCNVAFEYLKNYVQDFWKFDFSHEFFKHFKFLNKWPYVETIFQKRYS